MFLKKSLVIIATVLSMFTATAPAYAATTMEVATLQKVNEVRAANGLKALRFDVNLEKSSTTRDTEASQVWSHTRPNGSDFWTVDQKLVYGENLAKGYSNPNDVVNAWMASPSHKANLLSKDYTTCAITAVVIDGKTYWAQEFGIN